MGFLMSLLTAWMLLFIYYFFQSKRQNEKMKYKHGVMGVIFIVYLLIALEIIVGFPTLVEFSRMKSIGEGVFHPIIQIIPFETGFNFTDSLNILFFVPFGFCLPMLWRKYQKAVPTIFTGFFFSLVIEVGQLFTLHRASDTTDLLMNTCGTFLGWLFFTVVVSFFPFLPSYNQRELDRSFEPFMYIGIAVLATLLS